MSAPIIRPESGGDLFIGWAKAPAADRRFLVAALPLALAGAAGAGWALATAQEDPGAGAWRIGETARLTGALVAAPYPLLRVADAAAPFGVRSHLIVARGKCASALRLPDGDGRLYTIVGAPIERGSRRMIEVPLALDRWLFPADGAIPPPPIVEPLGRLRLAGEILDSKCFFGVMRPGRGRTHKACASLCIRGGVPPAFWAPGRRGEEAVLLLTDAAGGPAGAAVLPFVAEPVAVEGEIVRVDDLLQFRVERIARL